jgi:UDP-N-acetylglucosamine--N-acetylmuramyl-(pentapeptide) pyrophosphoryl-undecaprenol N-acetylglucosamine transferase
LQKIYSAVFGSGLGHVSRVYAIAKILEKTSDCRFRYSSFDEAYDFLKKYHEDVNYAPSVAIKWNLAGGVSGSSTVLGGPSMFAAFIQQVSFERRQLSRYNPRVTLSDSRLSAVLAAKSEFCPVVTILNQIRILFPPRFRNGLFANFLERMEADFLGLYWSLSNEVLIPDLPPPFTISEANISHVDISNKVYYTGFMTPKLEISEDRLSKVRSALELDSRPIVFMQISGPNATKNAFIQPALESAEFLSRRYNVIISKGVPSQSQIPYKLANGAWVYDWCPIKDELFVLGDVLVTRAGHTTISQCISTGKPSVLVPIFNHSEQIWNARKFASLGLGKTIASEDLTAQKLQSGVNECIDNQSYRENMRKMKEVSDKFDGIQEASNIVKGYL